MNIGHWIGYTFWIIKEIFVAGWDAIVAAFKPNPGMKPIVIYYPLRLTGEWEIFWFSSSITATPGTAWIEYEPRNGQLLLHVFDLIEGDDWVRTIKSRYESLLMEIFE